MSTFAVVFLSILFVLRLVAGLTKVGSLFGQDNSAALTLVLVLLVFGTEGYILYNLI